MTTQDTTNRATWSKADAQRWFASLEGYTDPGERAAIERVAREVRGGPVLDIGVGAGRTIALLAPLSDEYLAIDYLAPMVHACRRAHPGVRVELGDARELDALPSDHFALVDFSFNGIDAVSHADRARVLGAVWRVLRSGGLFLFSSLNLDGPGPKDRPWRVTIPRPTRSLRSVARAVRVAARVPIDTVRWWRIHDAGEQGEGYVVAPLCAHHYGVLAHFTTVARELAELPEAGFARDVEVYRSDDGRRWEPGQDVSQVSWLHFVARKPWGARARLA